MGRLSMPGAAPPLSLPGEPLIDWGGALRWYADPAADADVRAVASAAGGTASCWRGPAPAGRLPPPPPPPLPPHTSGERPVGEEGRYRGAPDHFKKKKQNEV